MTDFPNDADGDSLRRVQDSGSDLSSPMSIDFTIIAPNEHAARTIADLVSAQGLDPSISDNEGKSTWSVYCSKFMLATYDGVVAVQAQLNEIAARYGGRCDGWATFGNS
ncbi:MAG: ribonuclease E inhibitor RraB [Steroidobacteraceae bacterium]|jgi:hypothetical protein